MMSRCVRPARRPVSPPSGNCGAAPRGAAAEPPRRRAAAARQAGNGRGRPGRAGPGRALPCGYLFYFLWSRAINLAMWSSSSRNSAPLKGKGGTWRCLACFSGLLFAPLFYVRLDLNYEIYIELMIGSLSRSIKIGFISNTKIRYCKKNYSAENSGKKFT